jgi:uncharacterized DUF497 family protein
VPEKYPLADCVGLDWDEANVQKNWGRHRVTPEEAEEIFFNYPLVIRSDVHHSKLEKRYYALGQTSIERYLFAAFTIRRKLIRIISVRDMNSREQNAYVHHKEKNT